MIADPYIMKGLIEHCGTDTVTGVNTPVTLRRDARSAAATPLGNPYPCVHFQEPELHRQSLDPIAAAYLRSECLVDDPRPIVLLPVSVAVFFVRRKHAMERWRPGRARSCEATDSYLRVLRRI